jgi:hypothetical protein
MKKHPQKLVLSRETIHHLGSGQMDGIVGFGLVSECDTCELPGSVCPDYANTKLNC